ncbi:GNAT family N-acetyltransferase [Kribbella solani]|uniref:Phosphinothricin acetyltransferase n=1 Tax=Kribbella solani TaxID=236067 RepID=A0A841DJL0_9ACTN|nr:phosphinothricin acetyltransferase [Kribbella solani]
MSSAQAVSVGVATIEDLPGIVEILNEVAENSIANFSTSPTTVTQRQSWFERHEPTGPHRLLVARLGGSVLGFAASGPYRDDYDAFRETVEVSISLAPAARRRGVGTLLYTDLFDRLVGEPVHVALAGIALPNDASVTLHRKFGFSDVGTFREYARKNGQYISSLWMQRVF